MLHLKAVVLFLAKKNFIYCRVLSRAEQSLLYARVNLPKVEGVGVGVKVKQQEAQHQAYNKINEPGIKHC